ncbi:MAG TPA: PhzF family phenazine biosynthesis protein [Usitatibacter sp.]|jgi:PhzF family phenazine biosynthesis protein|nr:PhzF family phenazine biosynthesis protein [Usitatibacter sp.]
MASYPFRILNVFAREGRLTGNPLCVFEDGSALDDAAMQALARQFNLSETTFILPSQTASARVRIFTPSYEMPFAGHPTLGTAHVVREVRGAGDALTLEMIAGVIPVNASGSRWTLAAKAHRWREVAQDRAELATVLGLDASDIAERPLWVNAGKEQLVVPLASEDAVRRARPRADAFATLKSEDGQSMAYVFHDAGDASRTVLSRFFFPSGPAILEDPATGSACANLGGWFRVMRPGQGVERVVSQGEAVQRPSTLYLSVAPASGMGEGGRIFVGGRVLELGRGRLEL